jgi:hypothetical protein
MEKADVNLNKLEKNFTLKVRIHVTRQMKARLFLATLLIRLAARVLGCGLEFTGAKSHVK